MKCFKKLHCWVGSVGGNSTHVAFVSGQSHVPIFAPFLAPRILDGPIILPSFCFSPISHYQHAVVQIRVVAQFALVNSCL